VLHYNTKPISVKDKISYIQPFPAGRLSKSRLDAPARRPLLTVSSRSPRRLFGGGHLARSKKQCFSQTCQPEIASALSCIYESARDLRHIRIVSAKVRKDLLRENGGTDRASFSIYYLLSYRAREFRRFSSCKP
jgi:hypothetical protein